MGRCISLLRLLSASFGLAVFAAQASAVEQLNFEVTSEDATLVQNLKAASLVQSASDNKQYAPRDLLSAALADYGRLLEALYSEGYYGGVVRIQLNGREAANLPLLNLPAQIDSIAVRVDPGRRFRFDQARIAPLAPGSELPVAFSTGAPARSGAVRDAVQVAVEGWRVAGHAKATPSDQRFVADHRQNTLSAEVRLNPGPLVRFGDLNITTPSAVRADRIARIAGLPKGETFSPATLETVAKRLRRTGAFSSVAVGEAESLGQGDTLDVTLAVADEAPRRFGFGAELSSLEGLNLSGFWMHRNIFGGAERLRFDAEINQINANTSAIDYAVKGRLDLPATFGPDTTGFLSAELEHLDEPQFTADTLALGAGVTWYVTDQVEAQTGLEFRYSETTDDIGARTFTLLAFPTSARWDRRDNPLNPTKGFYVEAEVTPFVGIDKTASGARGFLDARAYRGIGSDDGVILAGRLQLGSVLGSALTATHPDFLFFSGGGGTVRGQPYQSLNVDLGGGVQVGGRSFLGVSTEVRASVTDSIEAVVFADAGYIGAESLFDGTGAWHSGAGLGLRYQTGIGPIRFDVAAPVNGTTSAGVQIYLGIGQAF